MKQKMTTKQLTTVAMLCAIAYVVMLMRIPISTVEFLKYDPKDVIIAIGGFIFGPLTALLISVIVSVIEMLTASTTGPIGLLMNIGSTCAFACTAAIFYKRIRNVKGAVLGLAAGTILMTAVMLLWNYFITPLYTGWPREVVKDMLVPAFLPFNLIQGGLNTGLTLLLYKPIVTVLRRTNLIPPSQKTRNSNATGMLLLSVLILVSFILFALYHKGII